MKTLVLAIGVAIASLLVPTLTARAGIADYVAHEWGTFTTVSGSDGILLAGMEREEEALPYFVHSHFGMGSTGFKGLGLIRPIANATVKLETPVLYFYHERALDLHVKVGFVGGSISQWYPERSGGETVPEMKYDDENKLIAGAIDFAKPFSGAIEWKIRSLGRGEASNISVLKQGDTPNWIRPRWPDSNVVQNNLGEKEKYLFYRGVGNFALPLRTTVDAGNTLALTPLAPLSFGLVYHRTEAGLASVLWKGSLAGGETRIPIPAAADGYLPLEDLRESIYGDLKTALVAEGLHEVEADAMLRTWWTSYFDKPGLRVFWTVPREITDAVLPIEITPAPRELERVLLGRSEVLTPDFEHELLTQFADPEKNRFQGHPLVNAYQKRVDALKAAGIKCVAAVEK